MTYSRHLQACFILTSILTLAACDGGGGGSGGTGGEGGNGGTAPNQADHEALLACGDAVCQSKGSAQRIELGDPAAMYNMECILQGARDRQPGIYQVDLSYVHSGGGVEASFTLFVTPTGEVEVAVHRESMLQDDFEEKLDPTERCTLKPADFFDACLVEVQAGSDAAFDCVYPTSSEGDMTQELPWFESCEARSPTCE